MGAKFRQCKAEIEAYKELRQKVKRGVFTVADIKVVEVPVPEPKQETQEIAQTKETVAVKEKEEEEEEVTPVADTQNQPIPDDELSKAPSSARESPVVSLLEYKSPLEHMEFLE